MTKYNARKTTVYGITFDSKLEANRYLVLLDAQNRGEIQNLSLQPKFTLLDGFRDRAGRRHRAITYSADFGYTTAGGSNVVEDTKGKETREFKLKKKMLIHRYPEMAFDFRVVKKASEEI